MKLLMTLAGFVTLALTGLLYLAFTSSNFDGPVNVILMGGQSNMAGRANFDELDSATVHRINLASERVYVSTNGKPPVPLNKSYSTIRSNKSAHSRTFGPEMGLGVAFAEANPSQNLLLVKTAYGSTSLHGAWNSDWTIEKAEQIEMKSRVSQKLASAHFFHTKKALKALKHQSRITGMIWMQGETDAQYAFAAEDYEKNIRRLIYYFRTRFAQPDLSFVIGQINPVGERFTHGRSIIREAMQNVSTTDPNVWLIKTSANPSALDFPKGIDGVHYNAQGQWRLGVAFAEAIENGDR
ncbi:MAG: sialate O-acetylesterase [Erythrobacter sp.]